MNTTTFADETLTYDVSNQTTDSYAAGGDPLTSAVTDPSGTITTVTDLLGRTVKYTDVLGTVTQTVYNILGQVAQTATTTPGTSTAEAELFGYDRDGDVTTVMEGIIDQTHGGAVGVTGVLATATYTTGQLALVKYLNGSSLASVTRDATGATTGISWGFPSGIDSTQNPVSDTVTRSQAGRVTTDTILDGNSATTSAYAYDPDGRLVRALVPHNILTYGYNTTTCGTNTGADGDRTSMTDTLNRATPTVTQYCYDFADRVTSTTVSNPPTGADGVTGTSLTTQSIGTAQSIGYDAHGNTTTLADETLTYDVTDQNTSITAGGTTVTYTRDPLGWVIKRATGTDTEYYAYSPSGQFAVLDSSKSLISRTVSLPGGATITIPSTGTATWSYPNLHGDIILTASDKGWRTGPVTFYDPFGQPIDPVTRQIGTTTADDAGPNTQPGDNDYGWVGAAGKHYEHAGDIATILMGARLYIPALGRFLQVDPVLGGNANCYNYPNDPINGNDLSGMMSPDSYMTYLSRGGAANASYLTAGNQARSGSSRTTHSSMFPGLPAPGPDPALSSILPPSGGEPTFRQMLSGPETPGSLDLGLEGCAILCASVHIGFGEQIEISTTAGIGIKAGVSGTIGATVGNAHQGMVITGDCKLVGGAGVYGGASLTSGNTWEGGGGLAIGGDAGCGVQAGYEWVF